ncbi:Arc family DNA-binding protein [Enterobacter sp.]|uniref:Arc family DNA-binding protein n=1 Tax=Enterobacter sp. TaxID=42895 RepID=UPI0039947A7E
MSRNEWKFVARIPEEFREKMYELAEKEDRSINYLVLKAIKELLTRNDEAPTTRDS